MPGEFLSAEVRRGDGFALAPVFLVGFMGAGKTSVGQSLSHLLAWDFADLDDRVVQREGRSIEQIFNDSGEAAFRMMEVEALRELLTREDSEASIIALGGGAFVQPEIAGLIERNGGTVIFLDAPVEDLLQRCKDQPVVRPLWRDPTQFRKLYERRRPHYLRASFRVETRGKTVEEVSAEIARALKARSF